MKLNTYCIKVVCYCIFFLSVVGMQAQLWSPVTQNKTSSKEKEYRNTIPSKYQLLSLDTDALKNILSNTPSRNQQKSTGTVIELPLANGVLEQFRVLEASIFEESLSEKFPDIKSYVAYGIDDPTAIARFSFSNIGLHVMISSGNHATVYIDPYTKDKKEYIIYSKSDVPRDTNSFECLVEDTKDLNITQSITNSFKNADDGRLRTFRLAIACTGEYSQYHLSNQGISSGASDQVKKEAVLAAMNNTMTRVNGIFERDLAITMVIVGNNTDIIFLDPNTDNFTNNSSSALINESQTVCDNYIGANNYDIGHTFSTGGGGLAQLYSPCTNSKARGITGSSRPIGDSYDVDYVAHEMGHQFGANHTQNNNCNRRNSASVEPGSASTIMGYAGICNPNVQNNSDDYFHAISIEEMWANISRGNSTCGAQTITGNSAPSADAGPNYTIPASTPFVLKGNATDPNSGDTLTYCWEQMDTEAATMPPVSSSNSGPMFRSLQPTAVSDRYMPALATVRNGQTSSTWEVVPSVSRTMDFRLTVRDNAPGGGSTASDDVTITVAGSAGPFVVNSPNNANISWEAGATQTVTWDVAGTTSNGINADAVDILLSTDGGNTFTTTIMTSVPNDGSQNIVVPNIIGNQNRIMVRGSAHIFYDISNNNFEITPGTIDTQAPSTPNGLTASDITQTSADLTWNASTDNIGVAGYDVYQDNTVIATVTTTSYQVTGLSPETSYSFSVVAFDAADNRSDNSNEISITTLSEPDTQAPSTPNGLVASDITQTSAELTWNASTDNIGVAGYDVYQDNTVIATVTTTSYQVTGLSPETSYSFSVVAFDAADNRSDNSNEISITTLSEPDTQAPSTPNGLVASDITTASVELTWNAATDNIGVAGYDVYQDNTVIATVTTTSYQVTGLSPETSYSFSVVAFDAADNRSDNSNEISITTLLGPDTQAPSTPNGLTASDITQTSTELTWNTTTDNIDVAGYDVYQDNTVIATVTTTSYQVTGLLPDTNYSFSVVAFDAADNRSDNSNEISITTLAEPDTEAPSIPNGLTASDITTASVELTWNASTDNIGVAGYDVYQDNTVIATITTTSYQVTGLSPETSYSFSVVAFDAADNRSDNSNEISITTLLGPDTQAPSTPNGLTASDITQTSVVLTWNTTTDNIGVTGYDVYRGNTLIATVTTTSHQVTGLLLDSSYSFSIVAFDEAGNRSDNSSTIGITTLSEPDTEAPSIPTGLTASNITISSTALTWSASTDNIGVSGYDIYQNNTIIATVTTTSYQVTGLSPDTNYSFSVVAFDDADNRSDNSNEISITTLSEPDTEAPSTPNGLTASNITQTSAVLTWNASTDNIGVVGYEVYRGNTLIAVVSTTSYQVTGLLANSSYSFSIVAFDDVDNRSDNSTTVGIMTLSEPDTEAPSTPNGLIASDITQTSVVLTWNASTDNTGVTGYDVYQGNTLIATVATTSYQVIELSEDTNYSFSIVAFDTMNNESDPSSELYISTLPIYTECNQGISSFPYNEGFENTLGMWTQSNENDLDWLVYIGATPSRNTGPTGSAEGDYYIYIESSGSNTGYPYKNAILNSPCIDLTAVSSASFSFSYHMRGNTMGSLDLEVSTDEGISWTSIFSKSGNQGSEWMNSELDLSAYAGSSIQLRFNAVTGSRSRSDIAIDNIQLTEDIIISDCTDVNLTINLDNYPEETSWVITNNEQVLYSGGTYPSQPDGSTVTITECLDPGVYTFTLYDSYGDGLCCAYGYGSYTLTSNGVTIASGGAFGGSESTTFTIGDELKELTVNSQTSTEAVEIMTFPNPVKNNDILNVVAPSENVQYIVLDMLGRTVLAGMLTQKSIDTRNLPSGMYALKLTIGESGKSSVLQFVKE